MLKKTAKYHAEKNCEIIYRLLKVIFYNYEEFLSLLAF